MKPIIVITPQYDSTSDSISMKNSYTDAVYKSGGIPVVLQQICDVCYINNICELTDGVLFSGGNDICPKYYGECVDEKCGKIDRIRDEFEMALYHEAAKRDLPILGICRGTQLINVCEGGKCHQHIDGHENSVHNIKIARSSLLHRIVGMDKISVNSFHHQASSFVPDHMKICAVADDGTIEAICKDNARFNLSVQWHHERTYDSDVASKSIFDAFIRAAKKPC